MVAKSPLLLHLVAERNEIASWERRAAAKFLWRVSRQRFDKKILSRSLEVQLLARANDLSRFLRDNLVDGEDALRTSPLSRKFCSRR